MSMHALEENIGDNSTIGVSEVSLLPEAPDTIAKEQHEQRLQDRRVRDCLRRQQESQDQHEQ